MSELVTISQNYKKEATRLLEETELVKDLSEFGRVVYTGAYAGDVMMHGDVDLMVVRDDPFSKEEIFTILYRLYDKGSFRSYFLTGDWDDPRKGEEFPNGHYIGLKLKVGDDRWKFDIWFVGRKDFEDKEKDFQIKNVTLTSGQQESILFFKKYRNDNKLSISGFQIYDAVLNKNCKNIEDLLSVYPKH